MPTALVCSDEFGPLARAEAEVLGMPGLPLILIPHPLAGNDAALVDAKARAIAAEVREALSLTPEQLVARYAARNLAPRERRLAGGAVCVDSVCAIDPATASAAATVTATGS